MANIQPHVSWEFLDQYTYWSKDLALVTSLYPKGMPLNDFLGWCKRLDSSEYARNEATSCLEAVHWLNRVLEPQDFKKHASQIINAIPIERALIGKVKLNTTLPHWSVEALSTIALNACRKKNPSHQILTWCSHEASASGNANSFCDAFVDGIQQTFNPRSKGHFNQNRSLVAWSDEYKIPWSAIATGQNTLAPLAEAFTRHDLKAGFHVACIKSLSSASYVDWLKKSGIPVNLELVLTIQDYVHASKKTGTELQFGKIVELFFNVLTSEEQNTVIQHAVNDLRKNNANPEQISSLLKNEARHLSVVNWLSNNIAIENINPVESAVIFNYVTPDIFINEYKKDSTAWLKWSSYITSKSENDIHTNNATQKRWLNHAIALTDMENHGVVNIELHYDSENKRIRERLTTLHDKINWCLEWYQTETMHSTFWGNVSQNSTYQQWRREQSTKKAYVPSEFRWMNPVLGLATYWFPEHAKTFAAFEMANPTPAPRAQYVRLVEETLLGKAIDWKTEIQEFEVLLHEFKPKFKDVLSSVMKRSFNLQDEPTILPSEIIGDGNSMVV